VAGLPFAITPLTTTIPSLTASPRSAPRERRAKPGHGKAGLLPISEGKRLTWDCLKTEHPLRRHASFPEYRQGCAANLRRELPRIPFVSATPGAKAQLEGAPNAALKRRSSTVTSSSSARVTSSRSSTVKSSNDGARVGASVEERPSGPRPSQ
jgi:hypothetical protein